MARYFIYDYYQCYKCGNGINVSIPVWDEENARCPKCGANIGQELKNVNKREVDSRNFKRHMR